MKITITLVGRDLVGWHLHIEQGNADKSQTVCEVLPTWDSAVDRLERWLQANKGNPWLA